MATDIDPGNDSDNDPDTTARNPLEALRRDHQLVRRLADAYANDTHTTARHQAAEQMLQALDLHARLEETVFYPAVRAIAADLVGKFEDTHHRTDDMLAAIRATPGNDPRREAMLRELIDATLQHIREEEEQLFPTLEQSGLDMASLGLQMQAFEANLVHMAARASDRQPYR